MMMATSEHALDLGKAGVARRVVMKFAVVTLVPALRLDLFTAPFVAEAEPAKLPRIGVLLTRTDRDSAERLLEPFRQRLRERNYVEGQNIAIEYRLRRRGDELLDLATQLVQQKVDIIVAPGTPAAKAAQEATKTIPIVAYMGDAIEMGLATRLAQPGRNITGISIQIAETAAKRLELLLEAVPWASRVAVLWNAANPNKALEWKETKIAAQALGVTLLSAEVRTPDDFVRAFAAISRGRADALITFVEALTLTHQREIVDFTRKNRLPMIAAYREFVEAGALMSYGVSQRDLYRHLAVYVDKILKGAKPRDLPIEQVTKLELLVNGRTAKALGLTIPQTLLVRADQVIE